MKNIEAAGDKNLLLQKAQRLADECEQKLDWSLTLGKEYSYSSLVFCIIDAVFSIGVHYSSAEQAVDNYARYYNLAKYNTDEAKQIHTVSNFVENFEKFNDIDRVASEVFCNSQRTSATNGITKAEACYWVAKVIQKYGIETISDFQTISSDKEKELEKEINSVKGQSSGIMLEYLFMLAGDENRCKPDRHLIAFVSDVLEKNYHYDEIPELIYAAHDVLKTTHIDLTIRHLDYLIWSYQRN